jgi:two-component system sensor histidine kinase RegB
MNNLPAHKNLKLLFRLRAIAIAGQAAAVLATTEFLGVPLPTGPIWTILGLSALLNALTWLRTKTARPVTDGEFFVQLFLDMAALFGLLYFAGGAANPFAPLFILQVVIASVTLPASYSWAAAFVTAAFYTALLFGSVPAPSLTHRHDDTAFRLHIYGMWTSFVLLAGIVAWFVAPMRETVRRRDALLAEAEKIAAVGALAANAAHELGTPLSTLAALAEGCDAEQAARLSEQIRRCKQILSRITAAGGVVRAEGGAAMTFDAFLQGAALGWRLSRPSVPLETHIQEGAAPRIVAERGLEQAIANLLGNAADASPGFVRLEASWTSSLLTVRIRDKGPGVPDSVKASLGEGGVTTKLGGMGMGLFLAKSVVARLEGTLDLADAPGGGTVAVVSLPLRRLAV